MSHELKNVSSSLSMLPKPKTNQWNASAVTNAVCSTSSTNKPYTEQTMSRRIKPKAQSELPKTRSALWSSWNVKW